jgi:hypothetical protein
MVVDLLVKFMEPTKIHHVKDGTVTAWESLG